MHLGGEAVGHVAGGGKPAGGIEQIGDGLLDGGELEAFDGAVFVAGDDAFVFKGPVGGLAGDEGRGRCDADGAVGEALAGEQLAGFVGDLGDLERGMKAEADLVGVLGRGEGDLGLGGEVVGGGVELGVDDVAGDVEGGALGALGRQVYGQQAGGKQRNCCPTKMCADGENEAVGSVWSLGILRFRKDISFLLGFEQFLERRYRLRFRMARIQRQGKRRRESRGRRRQPCRLRRALLLGDRAGC